MDNKIGIQELAAAIANIKEIDGSEAEIFCRSFFEVISEFLVKDKLVKIKGLGTFKLIEVSDRESINVNTGERIVIAGHTKMSFTPDSVLRDTVNRPFADFETTVLSENASTEKMEFIPAEPVKVEKPKLETPKPAPKPAPKPEPKQEPKQEAKPEPKQEAKPEPKREAKAEPKAAPKADSKAAPKAEPKAAPKAEAKPAKPAQSQTPPQQPKSNRIWVYVLAIVAVAVCAILFLAKQYSANREPAIDPAVAEKLRADSIAAAQAAAEKARIEKAKADSIAKAKADSDSIARINQAVMEYYEKHPEQRWRLERALRRSRARARRH